MIRDGDLLVGVSASAAALVARARAEACARDAAMPLPGPDGPLPCIVRAYPLGSDDPDVLLAAVPAAAGAAADALLTELLAAPPSREDAARGAHALALSALGDAEIFGLLLTAYDGLITDANGYTLRLLGYAREELIGRLRWQDITMPGTEAADARATAELLRDGVCRPYAKAYRHRDGRAVPVAVAAARVAEAPPRICAIVLDQSEARQQERLLTLSQEVARIGSWERDLVTGQETWSAEMFRLLGRAPGAGPVPTDGVVGLIAPEDRPTVAPVMRRVMAEGGDFAFDVEMVRDDGSRFPARATGRCELSDGRPRRITGALQDLTTLRRLEAEVREGEARFRALFGADHVGVLLTRHWTHIVAANPFALGLLGRAEADLAAGLRWHDINAPGQEALHERVTRELVEHGHCHPHEQHLRRPDGEEVLVLMACVRAGEDEILSVLIDLRAQRALEQQLARVQRLDSVGRLAGGIAHDFNNLLGIVLGFAEVAEAATAEPPVRRALSHMRDAATRGTALVRQLLQFARREAGPVGALDLAQALDDLVPILGRVLGEDVLLEVRRPEAPPPRVRLDAAQFEQVVVNLAANARDAMPDGGRLMLALEHREMPEGGPLPAGPYVALVVQDTGRGMDAATLARLFEPFFTTKAETGGTGLGLATCYGICRQAGGDLRAESSPGQGATLTALLPLVDDLPVAAAAGAPEALSVRGHETLLIVEDDADLRAVCAEGLRQRGYAVLEAGDAEAAIGVARTHSGPIAAVVSDVILPGAGVGTLWAQISGARPETRLLLTSGYVDDVRVRRATALAPGSRFLAKPFTPSALASEVRRLLDG
ncbi:MAG: PAS domain S-box protein [Gemmatimonadales bacterium]|nr:PAS domain S-box protein [Gemmatimonadales bacterium]